QDVAGGARRHGAGQEARTHGHDGERAEPDQQAPRRPRDLVIAHDLVIAPDLVIGLDLAHVHESGTGPLVTVARSGHRLTGRVPEDALVTGLLDVGYVVVRRVLSPAEVARLRAAVPESPASTTHVDVDG